MTQPVAASSRLRLLVPLTMVWSARNVVHSGVIEHLSRAGVEPVLLVPEPPDDETARRLAASGPDFAQLMRAERRATRLEGFVTKTLNFATVRRLAPSTFRLRRRWYERHYPWRTRLRNQAAASLSRFVVGPRAFERLRRVWERRVTAAFDLQPITEQIGELGCAALWVNNWGTGGEAPYAAAARRLGLPSVATIISFDNVLTKGVRPSFGHYLVWSARMLEDLLASDPRVRRAQVTVVGSPQFDFHRRPGLVWSREATLEQLGLPLGTRYLLYGAGREFHSPGELEMVAAMIDRLRGDRRLADHRLVVRLHPLDWAGRWRQQLRRDGVVLSEPFRPPVDRHSWSWSSLDDQALLVSSLRHADACLSVASTIALDAAILGTPAIGLRLDQGDDTPREVYFDAFDLEHYRPLGESGGLVVVRSWPQLTEALARAAAHPQEGQERRRRMIDAICGPVDGGSAERTARAIAQALRASVAERSVDAA